MQKQILRKPILKSLRFDISVVLLIIIKIILIVNSFVTGIQSLRNPHVESNKSHEIYTELRDVHGCELICGKLSGSLARAARLSLLRA